VIGTGPRSDEELVAESHTFFQEGHMPQGATILLAERDLVSTQLLLFILKRAGFEVITANGGAHLLALAHQRRVDLILSEVLLPDSDGMEICRQLRADWSTRHIPIVLLASHNDPDFRVRGLLAGADDYVSKPFDLNELMVRLNHLIEVYTAGGQLCPVTRLPERQMIRTFITTYCLKPDATPWAFLCLDLHYFRVYNQIYGYTAGDQVLALVGDLLREMVFNEDGALRFVGHLAADRFAVVVPLDEAAHLCETLITEFDGRILDCYPPERHETLYDTIIDRRGEVQRVPRLALAIGVVTCNLCEDLSYLELEDLGLDVVKRAKAEGMSSYYINQRRIVHRALLT
jgi:PleD family two-component response regulator